MSAVSQEVAGKLPWLIARASGLTCGVLLLALTLLGLLAVSGLPALMGRPAWKGRMLSWHRPLAWAAGGALAVHLGGLAADPWLHPGVVNVLAPVSWPGPNPGWAAAGGVSLWLAVLAAGAFAGRRRIPALRKGAWKRVHRAGALACLLAVAHAFGSGTDLSGRAGTIAAAGAAGLLAAAAALRAGLAPVAARRRAAARRPAPRRAALSLMPGPARQATADTFRRT